MSGLCAVEDRRRRRQSSISTSSAHSPPSADVARRLVVGGGELVPPACTAGGGAAATETSRVTPRASIRVHRIPPSLANARRRGQDAIDWSDAPGADERSARRSPSGRGAAGGRARARASRPTCSSSPATCRRNLATLEAALAGLRAAAPRLLFVAGNHDLWTRPGEPSSRDRYERDIPAACARAGARRARRRALRHRRRRLLPASPAGTTTRCAIASSTRPSRAPTTSAAPGGGCAGTTPRASSGPTTTAASSTRRPSAPRQVASLEAQLADAGARPTVVVTHHLPFAGLVTSKGEPPWDFINGFMGSERLGEAMLRADNVRAAVVGPHALSQARRRRRARRPLLGRDQPDRLPARVRAHGRADAGRARRRSRDAHRSATELGAACPCSPSTGVELHYEERGAGRADRLFARALVDGRACSTRRWRRSRRAFAASPTIIAARDAAPPRRARTTWSG